MGQGNADDAADPPWGTEMVVLTLLAVAVAVAVGVVWYALPEPYPDAVLDARDAERDRPPYARLER